MQTFDKYFPIYLSQSKKKYRIVDITQKSIWPQVTITFFKVGFTDIIEVPLILHFVHPRVAGKVPYVQNLNRNDIITKWMNVWIKQHYAFFM